MRRGKVEWAHGIESNFHVCSVKSLQGDPISDQVAACYFRIKRGWWGDSGECALKVGMKKRTVRLVLCALLPFPDNT